MNITKLNIGDTYKNSVGNVITVEDIYDNGNTVKVSCPKWTSTYRHTTSDVIDSINSGTYTDYKPNTFNQEEHWVPKIGDIVKLISVIQHHSESMWYGKAYFHKHELNSILEILDIDKRNGGSYKVMTPRGITGIRRGAFEKVRSHEIPSNTSDMNRTWKKEDFLNTKIEVDNPEKSKRFQEFLLQFGLQFNGGPDYFDSPFLFIEKTGTLMYGQLLSTFKGEENREIKYSEIFSNNNQSITTTNENNNSNTNDVPSTNLSGYGRKETATAISFSKTSCIASSRRLVGNTIQGRTIKTRVGRFEIQFKAITT